MSLIITPSGPHAGGGTFGPLDPMENSGCGQLRHCLVGTPHRLRASIRSLDALRYSDTNRWRQFMPLDPEGLLIRPTVPERYTFPQLRLI